LFKTNAQKSVAWQELYHSALIEIDREKLTGRIAAVEAAIVRRRQELTTVEAGDQERNAMVAAAEQLLSMKTEKLGWPSVKSCPTGNPQPDVIEKVRRVESIHHWHR
jgi:hypothetical protein